MATEKQIDSQREFLNSLSDEQIQSLNREGLRLAQMDLASQLKGKTRRVLEADNANPPMEEER